MNRQKSYWRNRFMEFTHKIPSVEAYNQLRVNAGMNSTKPHSEVKKALDVLTPKS